MIVVVIGYHDDNREYTVDFDIVGVVELSQANKVIDELNANREPEVLAKYGIYEEQGCYEVSTTTEELWNSYRGELAPNK